MGVTARGESPPVHLEQQGCAGLLSLCRHAFFRPFLATRKSNNQSPREKHQKPRDVRRVAGHSAQPRPHRPGAQTLRKPQRPVGPRARSPEEEDTRAVGAGTVQDPGGQHGPQRVDFTWETQRLCLKRAHGPRLAWFAGSPLVIGSSLVMCMCSLLLVLYSNPVPDHHLQALIPSSQVTF